MGGGGRVPLHLGVCEENCLKGGAPPCSPSSPARLSIAAVAPASLPGGHLRLGLLLPLPLPQVHGVPHRAADEGQERPAGGGVSFHSRFRGPPLKDPLSVSGPGAGRVAAPGTPPQNITGGVGFFFHGADFIAFAREGWTLLGAKSLRSSQGHGRFSPYVRLSPGRGCWRDPPLLLLWGGSWAGGGDCHVVPPPPRLSWAVRSTPCPPRGNPSAPGSPRKPSRSAGRPAGDTATWPVSGEALLGPLPGRR